MAKRTLAETKVWLTKNATKADKTIKARELEDAALWAQILALKRRMAKT